MVHNPHDSRGLAAQIIRQKKHAWDLDDDINWHQGVDPSKPLLPLDHNCLAFPGASSEQRLALSQFFGLGINSTICEMEKVINNMRFTAWASRLREYPVNPEMWELGDLFFIEENKHAKSFQMYNDAFCKSHGVDSDELALLLPKIWGSNFIKAVAKNADGGGYAFWWSVASVEEVSLLIYKALHPVRENLDPLFLQVHRRHMEEEVRHQNYAFLMLDLVSYRRASLKAFFQRKTDFLLTQVFSTAWFLTELHKFFYVKDLKSRHPFFDVLASCIPLFEKVPLKDLAKTILFSGPYLSQLLNTRNHPLTTKTAEKQRAMSFPFPAPEITSVYA